MAPGGSGARVGTGLVSRLDRYAVAASTLFLLGFLLAPVLGARTLGALVPGGILLVVSARDPWQRAGAAAPSEGPTAGIGQPSRTSPGAMKIQAIARVIIGSGWLVLGTLALFGEFE